MKLMKLAMALVLVSLVLYLLYVGQSLFLPLVIALVFWYLINLLADAYSRLNLNGISLPRWSCFMLSVVSFLVGIWAVVELISMNIDSVLQLAPTYQANLERRMLGIASMMGMSETPNMAQLLDMINIRVILTNLAASLTMIAANGGIIIIYIAFMLLEQGSFDRKIRALFVSPEKEASVRQVLHRIKLDVSTYFGIKLLTSTLTGVLSYIFLRFVGVDFSEFWAILIFLLNFIPTIGSIVATIFPSLITLVQFESYTPFFLVIGGVTSIQILIGNILEPRITGNSLNLSPLVILLNLSLWGLIWGIPGMFLCVPILVIAMIVFSHLPQTRSIAIILSKDGELTNLRDEER